jgi:molybdopterin converting factor small subunit
MNTDFKFRRAELLKALEPRGTWENHNELIKKAELLKGKTRLTKTEGATVAALVDNFKELHEAFFLAGLHAAGLIDVLNKAREIYSQDKPGAAKMLCLTTGTGKRGKDRDHNSIVATYLLRLGLGATPDEAVGSMTEEYKASREALIKRLENEKKDNLKSLPVSNTWPKFKPQRQIKT